MSAAQKVQQIELPYLSVETGQDTAGALVYWGLSGHVDMQDLEDALTRRQLDPEKWLPPNPSKEEVLKRAAEASLPGGRRQMVRPLPKRGDFLIVTEQVIEVDGKQRLRYEHNVSIVLQKDQDTKRVVILPFSSASEATAEQNRELAQAVARNVTLFEGLYTTTDISTWLVNLLEKEVRAVGLRDRGGFYFVPRDRLDIWRTIVGVVREVSGHKMFEIPAMRSDEAVEAILTAVRSESETKMAELEAYLAGDISTRGLNSWDAKLAELQGKVSHYADLLGVALPDLTSKAQTLLGALQAARIMKESEKEQ